MPRLLKEEAEITAQKVIKATYGKRYADAVGDYAKASHDFYDAFLGPELNIIIAAPEGHYELEDHLSFRWEGQYHVLMFDGRPHGQRTFGITLEIPHPYRRIRRFDHGGINFTNAPTTDISKLARLAEYVIYAEDVQLAVYKEMKTKYGNLVNRLRSMGPTQKIIEGWPEIAPYLPPDALAPRPKSTALTIPRAELNAQFGLPVE